MTDASTVGSPVQTRTVRPNTRRFLSNLVLSICAVTLFAAHGYTSAESPFSPTVEVTFIGPYGVGAGLGTFYAMPDRVPYVAGIWGSLALLSSEEEGLFEDYTETLIELQSGVLVDTSNIPVLQDIEALDVFGGLTLGRRSYTYLDEDYSKVMAGLVIGGLYAVNEQWSVGGKLSTMTQDPRLLVRYSF